MTQTFPSQLFTQESWKHVHQNCTQVFRAAIFIIAKKMETNGMHASM